MQIGQKMHLINLCTFELTIAMRAAYTLVKVRDAD